MTTYTRISFSEFVKNNVNLKSSVTQTARSSRDFLYKQLKELPNKADYFPRLYPGNEIYNYGSFSRRTKIRPLDDIDFLLVFAADGCSYNALSNDEVIISVPKNAENLLKLLNEDGFLSSKRLANKIKSNISQVSQYKNAEIRSSQEAVILSLSSYDWTFDIIPAFITDEESDGRTYYLIPNGNGNWKKTDPRIDKDRATSVNKSQELNVLEFIRLVKYWFKVQNVSISSYLIEILVLDYIERNFIVNSIKLELQYFFDYLKENINFEICDPKAIQGDLNELTEFKKSLIQRKSEESKKAIQDALSHEENSEYRLADSKWKIVFGDLYE